jgi:hypothetical protein
LKRIIASVLYWLAASTIALGAFGHGFLGVRPVRAAVAASPLAPDIVHVLWIVWYFVSGSMLAFGAILLWAWPALRRGTSNRSGPVMIVGALYTITGIAAYAYSGHDPFWLMFLVQGVIVIGATMALQSPRDAPIDR